MLFVPAGQATRAGLVPLAQGDAGAGDREALGWTVLLPAAAAALLAASWPGRASCDAEVCRVCFHFNRALELLPAGICYG